MNLLFLLCCQLQVTWKCLAHSNNPVFHVWIPLHLEKFWTKYSSRQNLAAQALMWSSEILQPHAKMLSSYDCLIKGSHI